MAVIAIVSAKLSPGASTAALACTLTWSGRVLLAECDPAGGDILNGYLGTLDIPGDHGLMQVAKADLHGQLEEAFWGQLIDLDAPHRQRLVLPGLTDLAQAAALRSTWPHLARLFNDLDQAEPSYDVIADCGRLSVNSPWPVLESAALVLLVMRPTSLRTVVPASPALALLRRHMGGAAGPPANLRSAPPTCTCARSTVNRTDRPDRRRRPTWTTRSSRRCGPRSATSSRSCCETASTSPSMAATPRGNALRPKWSAPTSTS